MIYYLIGFFISGYFFDEAKKRGQQPFLWFSAGFTACFMPLIIITGVFSGDVTALMEQYPNSKANVGLFVLLIIVSASGVLLVMAYQQLIKHASTEESSAKIHIDSLEIVETKEGNFSVGEKSFKTRKDAEDFVTLLKGMQ